MTIASAYPLETVDSFSGVDFKTDGERLALAALQSVDGMRVDQDGSMVGFGSIAAQKTLTGGKALRGAWYRAQGKLLFLSYTGTTLYLDELPYNLGSVTAKANWSFSSGNESVTMAEVNEQMFIQQYREALRHWNNTTVPQLASADTDLDEDGDTTDTLNFAGIAAHDGHLMGWGFGDQTAGSSGSEETGSLAVDRPEILRWSHLGQPIKWRPKNWLMVGTRGVPILAAHSCFGRFVVMKTEGLFVVYGSLEENLPAVEGLTMERGASGGIVGRHAWEFYGDVLYWMSRRGPMRWQGGINAEYIGHAVEGDLTTEFRNSQTEVVAVPQMNAILFMCYNDPLIGPSVPGDPDTSPGSTLLNGWLWDIQRERWVGKATLGVGTVLSAFVAPDTDGEMRVLYGNAGEMRVTNATGDTMGAETGDFTTGEVAFNGAAGGVVRGIFLEGDYVVSDGYWALTVTMDGVDTTKRFFTRTSTPTPNAVGDIWLKVDEDRCYESHDGSTWEQIPGLPSGVARLPLNTRCRTCKIRMLLTTNNNANATKFRKLAIQYRAA